MHKSVAAVFSCLCLSFATSAWAESPAPRYEGDVLTSRELLTTSRGAGLANAMTASASGSAALWHNPAAITSAMMYTFDAAYLFDNAVGGHGFEVNLVDMKSNRYVGAGIGMIYQYSSPDSLTDHLVQARLGLAVPLADNLISLGLTAVYSYLKHDGSRFMSQFTLDAGLSIRPLEWLTLAVSVQNLIVGDYESWMPRMISAGIAVGSIDLGLNVMFDTSFNLSADDIASTGSYGGGIEYTLKRLIRIRVGYRYEDGHHVIATGLGYRHGEGLFGLDLSYQHHFKYKNDAFSASLNLYF